MHFREKGFQVEGRLESCGLFLPPPERNVAPLLSPRFNGSISHGGDALYIFCIDFAQQSILTFCSFQRNVGLFRWLNSPLERLRLAFCTGIAATFRIFFLSFSAKTRLTLQHLKPPKHISGIPT